MRNSVIIAITILSIFQLAFSAVAVAAKTPVAAKKRVAAKTPEKPHQGFHTIPVWGTDDLKYYYTELFIGKDRQKTSVIIDTGSDYLAFPCNTCKNNCGKHKYPAYDILHSKTAKQMKCGTKVENFSCKNCKNGKCIFSRSYLEGSSLRGEVYSDYISILSDKDRQVHENTHKMLTKEHKDHDENDYKGAVGLFGCTNFESGLFKTQLANGIMGLGPKTNSKTTSPNFIDSLFDAHKVKSKNFSICLGTNGGYLTFGGYNLNKHLPNEPVQTVPYHKNYRIKFNGPGADAPVPNAKHMKYEAIVDSGTTFTYLNNGLWGETKTHFENWCKTTQMKPNGKGKICNGLMNLTNSYCPIYNPAVHGDRDTFFANFPKLYFTLEGGVQIIWFPKDYLYKRPSSDNTGKETWCISFNKENMGMGKYSTMGALFMRHYDVYFNRRDKTLSFVRSECEDKAPISYPVKGIKALVRRARILMGALLASNTGMGVILICMLVLLGFSAYRYGVFKKFTGQTSDSELAKVEDKQVSAEEPQDLEESMTKAE